MSTSLKNDPKISPFLWFDDAAEAAAELYVSLFDDSRILDVQRLGDVGPDPGNVTVVTFELAGLRVTALNGGPRFKHSEAFSFAVGCDDQAEVDRLWDALTANGGEESMCGWLKDRHGLSWQIVPRAFYRLMQEGDAAQSQRVMQAMLKMRKFDVAALERAARGD